MTTAAAKSAEPRRPLPKKLPMQFRFTEIGEVKPHLRAATEGGDPQVEPDAYDVTLTTDSPIDQGYCQETLGHDPGECDLSYAKRGVSFMLEHGNKDFTKPPGFRDPNYHLGIIEELEVGNGKLTGVARFAGDDALSELALRVKRDWASGRPTRPFLSGGFVVMARRVEEPTKPNQPIKVRFTKWQIREASNVSLPADPRAGKNRSVRAELFEVQDEASTQDRSQEATKMEPTTTTTTTQPAAPAAAAPVAVGDDRMKQRAEESAQIVSLCVAQNCAQRAAEFIQAGLTLADVKTKLFDELSTRSQQQATRAPSSEALDGLSAKDRRRYSYRKAALASMQRGRGLVQFERSLEGAVHKRLLEMRPDTTDFRGGVLVPYDLRSEEEIVEAFERRLEERTMGSGIAGKGAEWVGQQTMPLVEILEAQTVLARLGANFNTALSGNLSYPRETGQPSVVFQGENPASGVSATDGQTGEILSGPKTMIGAVKMSRQWLFQTNGAGEARVRNALVNGTARALDRNAFNGTGAGSTPLGIYNVTGVGSVAMGSVTPTWPKITDMGGKVSDQNADLGRMGFATTALLAWRLMSALMAAGVASPFIWTGPAADGLIGGYRAIGSTQVPKNLGAGADEHGFVFGNWAYCDVNLWGATEIVVDELTAGDYAQVIFRSYGMGDVVFTHPEAFAVATAAKPA